MEPKKRTTRTSPATTTTTTTPMTDEQLKTLIAQGVADVLAEHDATRSRNGEDSHDSGTGVRRTKRVARECTYPDFMKCQPLDFKGTEGVVELTQWFERMETVFHISNCTVGNQIKFATFNLLGSALTWWNSHVMTVGYDVTYAMTWTNLKNMMTNKYRPKGEIKIKIFYRGNPLYPKKRGEIKKLKVKMWNLKVKGVADALAERDADRSMNGDDSHDTVNGVRRQAHVPGECTYPYFMKCQPVNFKGTEGVVELT
ncbi:hypothetical protein Tco_0762313 [Tanacetum coccineum]